MLMLIVTYLSALTEQNWSLNTSYVNVNQLINMLLDNGMIEFKYILC